MSDFEFIIAMVILAFAVIGVIAGVIFLMIKSKQRAKEDIWVYVSATGKCYHTDSMCCGNEYCESILCSQAIKNGYSPCSKCCK